MGDLNSRVGKGTGYVVGPYGEWKWAAFESGV